MTIRIAIVALDQCLASAIAGSIDFLHAANLIIASQQSDPLFSWKIVTPNSKPIRTSNGMIQAADTGCRYLREVDVIYLPGIALIDESHLTDSLIRNQKTIDWLLRQAEKDRLITSSCTGSFFLAESGLLDAKPATTAWPVASFFADRYPDVILRQDKLIVEIGNIITSGSANSYQDLMLRIIQHYAGENVSRITACYMLADKGRDSQAAYRLMTRPPPDDFLVQSAHKIIQESLTSSVSVSDLATQLHVSDRTLMRRFKQATGISPNTYIQELRIERAKHLLETTSLSHDEVAISSGYLDTSSFRRLFKRRTGMTMRDYKNRFGSRS